MSEVIERKVPSGLLRFENYGPGEWLTKKGEPAKIAKRRYLHNDVEFDSMSSVIDTLSKPGLYPWYEDHGARGAVQAERLGELGDCPPEEIVKRIRALGLGATAQKDEGADRGHAIHTAFHTLATTGERPNPDLFVTAWRPWVEGAIRAWDAMVPRSVQAELIVCQPGLEVAGRFDLLAHVDGRLTLIDYKTNKGRVFDQAHYQTRGYARCLRAEGIEVERILIVGIDDDGGFQLVDCEATDADFNALLQTFRSRKRINAGMAAQRKAAKAALKALGQAA